MRAGRLWRHQDGVWSLGFLCQQLNDHRLNVKEQDVHVGVCQVGLHCLDHQGIVGVFRQVALGGRKEERGRGEHRHNRRRREEEEAEVEAEEEAAKWIPTSRLVASVCSLCWAMFFSAARLRRVIACFRASTVAGASSSQAFKISTAVMPITQRSRAPENTGWNVDGAIGAAHHQVVVRRPPLNDLDGEEVSRRQHDAFPLPEAEQADGVVAGHGADTVLHPGLQQRKHRR
ncbi:hypothetical protein EYF80_036223 [Liparis tanakae]|uniref:Uncharacterized protein n=1 Tax=Liparis tanakae TaxID=230148 RepID=A0A4Z2GK07_9TELE|nr:hypothetical protein EYF80_036223 [Liparis tanakae]